MNLDKFDALRMVAIFDDIARQARESDQQQPLQFVPIDKPARRVHPILYLPIEIKSREWESKLLIARDAVAQGFRVVIGNIWAMTTLQAHAPPGLVLFKTMTQYDASNMISWIKRGHMVTALDEEAFGIAATSSFLTATTNPLAAALADAVFAQGATYKSVFPYPVNVEVTGNPRTTTYPHYRAGKDILVCMQSGNINNNGRSFEDMIKGTLKLGPPLASLSGQAWAEIIRASIRHECVLLPLVLSTIQALALAFPDRRIVVRPHPVEDPATWNFEQSNIVADTHGNIITSLQEAATLVYVSGCTTGLDGFYTGVPAVRLGAGGLGISASMHIQADTPEQAVAAVRRNEIWRGSLDNHLATAVDLVTPLRDMYRANRATEMPTGLPRVKAVPYDFHQRKFPDTQVDEVRRLTGLAAREIGWNMFVLDGNPEPEQS